MAGYVPAALLDDKKRKVAYARLYKAASATAGKL